MIVPWHGSRPVAAGLVLSCCLQPKQTPGAGFPICAVNPNIGSRYFRIQQPGSSDGLGDVDETTANILNKLGYRLRSERVPRIMTRCCVVT